MPTKYTFFNISKANDRIAELEALIADRDLALAAAQDKITELATLPQVKDITLSNVEQEKLKADLATAQEAIGKKDAEISRLTADVVKAKVDAEHLSSLKAHQITAGQGQPPIAVSVTETPAKAVKAGKELHGLELAIAAHKAEQEAKAK